MTRVSTFQVDASSVQDNPGATATFKRITVGERKEYLAREDINDIDMLRSHLVSWSGIVDDSGNELPSPEHEPDAIDALYMSEMRALSRLLWQGPDGDSAKN
jgi:hypothetical protein